MNFKIFVSIADFVDNDLIKDDIKAVRTLYCCGVKSGLFLYWKMPYKYFFFILINMIKFDIEPDKSPSLKYRFHAPMKTGLI